MESFWNDLHYEDIHFRDTLQFEIQSDFAPIFALQENISTQEFYCFIPSSLQINSYTYSKEQFYKDRTNLIRYKTPEFSLQQLIDPAVEQSPLNRIRALEGAFQTEQAILIAQDELKLLSNVVRSALRVAVRELVDLFGRANKGHIRSELQSKARAVCREIIAFRSVFHRLQIDFERSWSEALSKDFLYADEFISSSIDYYLTGFLEVLRRAKVEHIYDIDNQICEIIIQEKQHRQQMYQDTEELKEDEKTQEKRLNHKSLLNKYVLDALLLEQDRISWVDKYGNVIAGLAAGIAMLVYGFLLFINVSTAGVNSISFVLLTVVLYILKDRVKDALKRLFHQHASRWFSDFTTRIRTPSKDIQIGKLKESFSFVAEEDVPEEIRRVRYEEFASDLPLFKIPEEMFYYKKEMVLVSSETPVRSRRHKLHTIFLFNIHLLLEKASNPTEPYLSLDLDTMEVGIRELPKVYHINIIMKNTFTQPDLSTKVEIKKFRLVIDKNGIKRVETV
ncbi:MAG: hypothetical protein JSR46_11915 [Verrucomicrobia bacterium]|nr:hypothetical protein [Verrucomicrobiota bacterium]